MGERFLGLPEEERRAILVDAATDKLRKDARVLEKDVWVCWSLDVLFGIGELREHLAFKGGTTLSKVFGTIERFSEDVDVTMAYESQVTEDEVEAANSKTKRKKLGERLVAATVERVREVLLPIFSESLEATTSGAGKVEVGESGEELRVVYPSVFEAGGYLREGVLLEFGGRNVSSPAEERMVRAEVAPFYPALEFPEARVRVLAPKRTFWEKVTLIHAELGRPNPARGATRRSRHLYDVVRLAEGEIGEAALGDLETLEDVVRIKETFFYAKWAEYGACLEGELRLVPAGEAEAALRADYDEMCRSGMFYGEPPSFDEILKRLGDLERDIRKRLGR